MKGQNSESYQQDYCGVISPGPSVYEALRSRRHSIRERAGEAKATLPSFIYDVCWVTEGAGRGGGWGRSPLDNPARRSPHRGCCAEGWSPHGRRVCEHCLHLGLRKRCPSNANGLTPRLGPWRAGTTSFINRSQPPAQCLASDGGRMQWW